MTDTTNDALLEEIAKVLGCREMDFGYILDDPRYVNIAAIGSAKGAEEALRRVHSESDEYHAILTRWAELAPTIDELIRIQTECYLKQRLRGYVELRMVMLCETRKQIEKVASHVEVSSAAWVSLVLKARSILRNEKEN